MKSLEKPTTKKVLFIQDEAIRLGGTKVLIARLSEQYLKLGYEVDILIKTNTASVRTLKIFPDAARILFFDSSRRIHLFYPLGLRSSLNELHSKYELMISLSVQSFFFSYVLLLYKIQAKSFYYVVNNEALRSDGFEGLYVEVLKKSKKSSFLFMNDECRDGLSQKSGRNFFGADVIPLPVTNRNAVNYVAKGIKKIVSIGRIDPLMKTYNWNLIREFVDLRARGYEFEWHIYGGGYTDDVKCLLDKIKLHRAENFIIYHGELPYPEIENALSEAYMFVGMGTILVESSMLGVPGVAAIAYSESATSNGLFHELPFGNVGEPSKSIVAVSTTELVEELLELSSYDYQLLRDKASEEANKYSVSAVFDQFLKSFTEADTRVNTSKLNLIKVFLMYVSYRIQLRLFTKI